MGDTKGGRQVGSEVTGAEQRGCWSGEGACSLSRTEKHSSYYQSLSGCRRVRGIVREGRPGKGKAATKELLFRSLNSPSNVCSHTQKTGSIGLTLQLNNILVYSQQLKSTECQRYNKKRGKKKKKVGKKGTI